MEAFIRTLLECSVAMTVISLIYMSATPLLSKRYSAKWLYYVWLVIVIGWIFPFRPQLDVVSLPVEIPSMQTIQVIPVKYMTVDEPMIAVANEASRTSSIPLWWIIVSIWVIGAVGTIIYHFIRHWRFVKLVNRWSEDIISLQILNILNTLRTEMKIGTHVGLKTCSGITGPMMVGFFRPVIFLPGAKMSSDELTFILRHELIHLKRNDLWYKVLVLLTTAIHWFNPIVHIMAKAIGEQCEISCDELVLHGTNFEQRKQYGETIIGVVRTGAKLRTALSTNFYGGKRSMKTRIFSIMDTTKKKAGITILCVVLIATIGTGIVFAAGSANNGSFVNIVAEKQEKKPSIGTVETKKVIDIDAEFLNVGEFVCVGGPYTLDEGDIIQYDITSEGKGRLNVELRKTDDPNDDKGYLGHSWVAGNSIRDFNSFIVSESLAGEYYLWIGNFDGKINGIELTEDYNTGTLSNIKGTVKIAAKIEELYKEQETLKTEVMPSNQKEVASKLIGVKMSDESKFRPEEWKDILAKVESGEVALEDESSIGLTKSKQDIDVDVKSLDSGEFVCLGRYTLEKGDIIKYNIAAERDSILNIGFSKTADPLDNNQYLGHSGSAGNSTIIANHPFIFKNSLSGTYYLWVGNPQFQSLNNIKGAIEIAEE
ncbi:MAG TPA: M56 family metallopeptidase [Thermoanaerobacterales bacterium]|jgi:bla regulator protein BlaR1|nr:M56 family metallopeptidase [Thermoanaerobacterales bacterium]